MSESRGAVVAERERTEAVWKRRYRAPRSMFPRWARDNGDRLLYLSNHTGKFEVFAWDRARDAHRQATDRPEGTGYRVGSALDPSGEHIWWWNDRRGDEFGTWTVERFDGRDRREAATLDPSYSAGLELGRTFAVIGRSTDTGTDAYVVPNEDRPLKIYEHRQWAHITALSADEQYIALSHAEHGDSRNPAFRVIDLAGSAIADLWDGPDRGLEPGEWSPVPGDGRIVLHHEREGIARPLLFDARTGAETRVEVDLPGEIWAVDWYPDARSLLLKHDHRARMELYRYDLATKKLTKVPTERGTIDVARVRPDGEVWYQWNGSSMPERTRTDGRVVLRAPGPEAPAGVAYSDIDVRGIHAFIAEPKEGTRPRPAIFIIHGGPEWHDRDAWSAGVQAWADHGFAVVLVNYRGSTGYGKAWRDAIKGKPGLTELEDIAAVQDAVVASGLVDPKRCVMSGGSWGGYLTLLALGVQPERWAAGIGIVPIGDYIAAFEDEMEPLKRYDAALFGGTPTEIPDVYRERNPITYVDRVRAPLFMVVGQNDPRCPSRSVDIYEERLRELGKRFDTYRYDAGHGSLRVEEQIKQTALQIGFLADHLGTRPPID